MDQRLETDGVIVMRTHPTGRSAQAAFLHISRSLERIERYGDLRALRKFIGSEEFTRNLFSADPGRRSHVLFDAGRIETKFRRQIGPLIKVTRTKAAKWNEVMIARLRKAEEMYGDDEDIARALRITVKAAARARLRYIGRRVENYHATLRGSHQEAA